ncbi:MAG: hypothetical protein ABIR57_12390, partial [Aeromicrobium sp.]
MIGAFDRWVASGKTSYTDLAIFRIVYAVLALITLPRLDFVSKFPGSLYRPPPGPFRLLSGVPPHPVFLALQVMLMLSLVCL